MPAGDQSGPWGAGSRTGRGLGLCSGYSAPGYAVPGGRGRGRGVGRGFCRGFGAGFHPGWNSGNRYSYTERPGIRRFEQQAENVRQGQLEALGAYVAELDKVIGEVKRRLDELAPKEDNKE